MRIISVDDEEITVEYMERLLKQVEPEADFAGFTEPEEAFSYLSENSVDVALLDIEMGEYNGIELAKKCKEISPEVNIIFVTGYSQYTMEAFKLRASGYLMKPVRATDLRTELENLRHPLHQHSKHRVRVQTFGNFEVFIDNRPLYLPRTKCLECLAYLVDRKGALIGTEELAALLWEDRPYDRTVQNNVYRVVSDLAKSLKKEGIEDILVRARGQVAIDVKKIDCDYFGFLNGDVAQINAFHGEYMTNYSWAEFTLAQLVQSKI